MPLHQTAALWTDGRTCIECAGRESYSCSNAKFSEQVVGEFVWILGLCWVWLWRGPFWDCAGFGCGGVNFGTVLGLVVEGSILGLCWVWLWRGPFWDCAGFGCGGVHFGTVLGLVVEGSILLKYVKTYELGWMTCWLGLRQYSLQLWRQKGLKRTRWVFIPRRTEWFLTQCNSVSLEFTYVHNYAGSYRSQQDRDYNRTIQNYVFVLWVWGL